ncbi:hypothetical protein CAPTEDRAFT_191599 [Capitella teleta]|uniref:PHD-type domain-containing protein n=1 Tax=Capitella teleta TaxID=283909 RepID=R7VA07_CAPTE|nr:hypothetical protein CAPTEDRAFT_191599 [Capitella teleta]|eukprot:ELU15352.1 hypothetical protein CAPTEDRAFT_191599 [Capitella teleta]
MWHYVISSDPTRNNDPGKERLNLKPNAESESESDNECWTCVECQREFEGSSCQMLECERCFDHFCIECLEMGVGVYKYLQRDVPNTLWCCQSCCKAIRATFPPSKQAVTDPNPGRQGMETNQPDEMTPRVLAGKIEQVEEKLASMEGLLENVCRYFAEPTNKEEATSGNPKEGATSRVDMPKGAPEGRGAWGDTPVAKAGLLRTIIREESEEALKEAERAQRRRKNVRVRMLGSAMRTFGKCASGGITLSRSSGVRDIMSHRTIRVQPTAIARRKLLTGSRTRAALGRPHSKCHSSKRPSLLRSQVLSPRKVPHKLATCVSENRTLGKTHSTK